jgi:hypothetical protein
MSSLELIIINGRNTGDTGSIQRKMLKLKALYPRRQRG